MQAGACEFASAHVPRLHVWMRVVRVGVRMQAGAREFASACVLRLHVWMRVVQGGWVHTGRCA